MISPTLHLNSPTSTGNGNARSHFLVNIGSNIAYMLTAMLVMLWYVPFVIDHLGMAAYGMVPLINSLVMYMTIATEGFNVAINRYLTIDINRNDPQAANITFNTAFFAVLLLVCLLLPVMLLAAWWFPTFFQAPDGLEQEARLLFGCVMLTFFLTVVGSNFEVSTLALHRFDLRNLVRTITLAVRVGVILLLFKFLGAHLWQIGVGFVFGAVVTFLGAGVLWHRLTPQLHIQVSHFDRRRLGALLSLSGWSVINRLGMLLFLSVDLVIINLFLGASHTGEYGTLILFPELLRNLADTVTSVLNPAIVGRYATGDWDGLYTLAARAVKLLGVALALPIGLICGLAQPFLTLWLGTNFQHLHILLIVLVGHLSITLATLPLTYVLTSYNRVKIQGVTTLVLGMLNVVLAIVLAVYLEWGTLGVAAATALMFIVKNLFFLSGYSAYVMKQPWWTFYPVLLAGAIGTVCIGLGAYGLTMLWPVDTWLSLIGVAATVSLVYGVAVWCIGLNQAERHQLLGLCPPPVQRYLF